ncbi:hypothetical protein AT984_05120 [Paucibacter sp. KCTC 42545]|nr:hypothetical protein AT984_05120 [Paucibacter sp. KCTC 42545]
MAQNAAAAEIVPLYSYYTDPPYSPALAGNLSHKLAGWLSRKSGGRYQFVASEIPRARLDRDVLSRPGWLGVVAWVGPDFMLDPTMQKYWWSEPLLRDAVWVASRRDKPVDFVDISSFDGLVFGAIRGRQLPDMDAAFAAGRVRREDGVGGEANLRKLQLGRIDVTFVQAAALPFFREQIPGLDSWLYVAAKPRLTVERRLMSDRSQVELNAFLRRCVLEFRVDPEWRPVIESLAYPEALRPYRSPSNGRP